MHGRRTIRARGREGGRGRRERDREIERGREGERERERGRGRENRTAVCMTWYAICCGWKAETRAPHFIASSVGADIVHVQPSKFVQKCSRGPS